MKNKASLILMEQLIMILVFALAAALCLQVFAKSVQIAEQTACRDAAVQMAQNGAELWKQGENPISENDHFTLKITENITEIPGYEEVKILVSCECGVHFELAAGRQEVAE